MRPGSVGGGDVDGEVIDDVVHVIHPSWGGGFPVLGLRFPMHSFNMLPLHSPKFVRKVKVWEWRSFVFQLAPPLLLWAMLALSGLVHWNHDDSITTLDVEENSSAEVNPEQQSSQLSDLRDLVNQKQG